MRYYDQAKLKVRGLGMSVDLFFKIRNKSIVAATVSETLNENDNYVKQVSDKLVGYT